MVLLLVLIRFKISQQLNKVRFLYRKGNYKSDIENVKPKLKKKPPPPTKHDANL